MDINKLKELASTSPSIEKERPKISAHPSFNTEHLRRLEEHTAQRARDAYRKNNPVVAIRESIERHVRQFESALNHDQEVMIMAASFGSQVVFYVDSIEFNNPDLIIFHGTTDSGKPMQLIQHHSQLNFLLQAGEKHNPDKERRPIGFVNS